jgi:hypothetical protein
MRKKFKKILERKATCLFLESNTMLGCRLTQTVRSKYPRNQFFASFYKDDMSPLFLRFCDYSLVCHVNILKYFRGSVDCLIQAVQKEGFLSLYKGFIPCWLRHVLLSKLARKESIS